MKFPGLTSSRAGSTCLATGATISALGSKTAATSAAVFWTFLAVMLTSSTRPVGLNTRGGGNMTVGASRNPARNPPVKYAPPVKVLPVSWRPWHAPPAKIPTPYRMEPSFGWAKVNWQFSTVREEQLIGRTPTERVRLLRAPATGGSSELGGIPANRKLFRDGKLIQGITNPKPLRVMLFALSSTIRPSRNRSSFPACA